ncbi:glycine cleavage system H protein-like [Styela clava]
MNSITRLRCFRIAKLISNKKCFTSLKTPIILSAKRTIFSSFINRTRYFTEDHIWVSVNDVSVAGTLGVTDYVQNHLGEIVYCELPEVGTVGQNDTIGTLESVKAASDIFSPVSGDIVKVNELLNTNPSLVNQSPMSEGWIAKIKLSDVRELDQLMDEDNYIKYTEEL